MHFCEASRTMLTLGSHDKNNSLSYTSVPEKYDTKAWFELQKTGQGWSISLHSSMKPALTLCSTRPILRSACKSE